MSFKGRFQKDVTVIFVKILYIDRTSWYKTMIKPRGMIKPRSGLNRPVQPNLTYHEVYTMRFCRGLRTRFGDVFTTPI